MSTSRRGVAVVGAGRAGQARIRAIQGSLRARLAAVVTHAETDGATLAAVLASPQVDAVVVCTPNLLHESSATQALDAGKHVAVEFPLAASAGVARALFRRADERGLVLHEEHIELLSPSQLALRARARELGAPRKGLLRFRGDSNGWMGDPALAGSPALCSLARLHRLLDLFGSAELRAARLRSGAVQRLEVELGFAGGGVVTLCEERGPGLARSTEWSIECERGPLTTPPPEPPTALFARDLELFLDRIESGGESYVSDARVLEVLELVGAIERRLC